MPSSLVEGGARSGSTLDEKDDYRTRIVTGLLNSVAPAAVALTHAPIEGTAAAGTSAQACAVTSVSAAVSLARKVYVPFFTVAFAVNAPVAPVFVLATLVRKSTRL